MCPVVWQSGRAGAFRIDLLFQLRPPSVSDFQIGASDCWVLKLACPDERSDDLPSTRHVPAPQTAPGEPRERIRVLRFALQYGLIRFGRLEWVAVLGNDLVPVGTPTPFK
jgi:hypothetical protein